MMNEKDNVLLDVQNLKMYFKTTKGFNKQYVKAVDDISFKVRSGETLGLVGESGCGKTTTGKCILRINDPTDGHIFYKGTDIAKLSKSALKSIRRDIQLIFQDPYGSLNPRQNLGMILKDAILGDHEYHSREEVDKEINRLLTLVELLPSMVDRYPHELSGGQRQRLGIARALACKPTLIVCDEPVSALDVSIQAQIINLFERLREELGLTYVFIAHDIAVVKHIADTIAVMYLGHIVEMMDSKHIFKNPIHPYTKSLLSAVPTVDYDAEKTRERIILQGEVPSPTRTPDGCPFHPRCVYAKDICSKECPSLRNLGMNHSVACHFASESDLIRD